MDIRFKQVDFTYQPNTPFEQRALFDINLTIQDGSYTAIVGHTGSGKSTLLQHLNALVKPTKGQVTIGERVITPETDNKNLKPIRKKLGSFFNFQKHNCLKKQWSETSLSDRKTLVFQTKKRKKLAKKMLDLVGLDEKYLQHSPFELSGGQMRRVAIAGVLAMEPEVLVLDEPTAGLDPKGRKEMMEMFSRLHKEHNMTIVLVTHLMDDVANYADHVIVLEKGQIVRAGAPQEVFQETQWLKEKQLGVPTAAEFAEKLVAKGFSFEQLPLTADQLADQLLKKCRKQVRQNDE